MITPESGNRYLFLPREVAMRALIDADMLLYAAGFAGQHNNFDIYDDEFGFICSCGTKKEALEVIDGQKDLSFKLRIEAEPIENILYLLNLSLESIIKETSADSYKLYLTGKDNFRNKICPEYKANRKDVDKPIHHEAIKQHLINKWGAEVVDGMEADDAMGIAQSYAIQHQEVDKIETIICSLDKDMLMIPGWHYNWKKKEKRWIDDAEAQKFFYTQLLTGDTVDNIFGIKGIGPKKAAKLLKDAVQESDMRSIVYNEYKKQYLDVSRALKEMDKNERLLWILREHLKS